MPGTVMLAEEPSIARGPLSFGAVDELSSGVLPLAHLLRPLKASTRLAAAVVDDEAGFKPSGVAILVRVFRLFRSKTLMELSQPLRVYPSPHVCNLRISRINR
jgi:hypothetical protein